MVHGSWGAPGVERYYRDIVTRDDSERRRRRPADVRPVVDRRPRIHMREPRRIMTRLGITLLVLYTLLRLARVGLEQGAEDQDYRNLPERPQPGLLDITGLDYRPVRTAHNPCHGHLFVTSCARGALRGHCSSTSVCSRALQTPRRAVSPPDCWLPAELRRRTERAPSLAQPCSLPSRRQRRRWLSRMRLGTCPPSRQSRGA